MLPSWQIISTVAYNKSQWKMAGAQRFVQSCKVQHKIKWETLFKFTVISHTYSNSIFLPQSLSPDLIWYKIKFRNKRQHIVWLHNHFITLILVVYSVKSWWYCFQLSGYSLPFYVLGCVLVAAGIISFFIMPKLDSMYNHT